MQPGRILLSCAVLVALGLPAGAAPDEDLLGKAAGYPSARAPTGFMTSASGRVVQPPRQHPAALPLKKAAAPRPLPKMSTEPRIEYRFEQQTRTLDDFLDQQRVTGSFSSGTASGAD